MKMHAGATTTTNDKQLHRLRQLTRDYRIHRAITWLGSENPLDRAAAIRALAELDDPLAEIRIIRAATDTSQDPDVRQRLLDGLKYLRRKVEQGRFG